MLARVSEEPGLSGSLARYRLAVVCVGQKYQPVFPKVSIGGNVVLSCEVTGRQLEPPLLAQLVVALGASVSAATAPRSRGTDGGGEVLSPQAANRMQPIASEVR